MLHQLSRLLCFAALLLVAGAAAVSLSVAHQRGNATAAARLLSPFNDGGGGVLDEVADAIDRTLTASDFLRTPFSLANPADLAVFRELTADAAAFQAWRENTARARYHMELADYAPLFAARRAALFDLARSLSVLPPLSEAAAAAAADAEAAAAADEHLYSYDQLLRRCDAALATRERASGGGRGGGGGDGASFVESRLAVAALHASAHLFEGRLTLHALAVQDALEFGLVEKIKDVYNWLKTNLPRSKCLLCRSVVQSLKRGICNGVGEVLCTAAVSLMTAGVGATASRFFCGFPVYMGAILGRWCTVGVTYLQQLSGATNQCICGFNIPAVSLPAVKFSLLGKELFNSPKTDLVKGGPVCATQVGQCSGTKEQRAAYEARRAVAEKEELARIAAMTQQEKAWYHYRLLAGEFTTNLSDKLVEQTLASATGLGSDVLATVMKFGPSGGLKNAVLELSKKAMSRSASQVGKAAAKAVSSATTGAVQRMVLERGRNVAYKGADLVGGTLTKVMNSTAQVAGKAIGAAQAKVVLSATKNATLAAAAGAATQRIIQKVGSTVASVAGNTVSFAGKRVVDVAEVVAGKVTVGKKNDFKALKAVGSTAATQKVAAAASEAAEEGINRAAAAVANSDVAKRVTSAIRNNTSTAHELVRHF